MEGAVNENSDIYWFIWVGQVELYSSTAHWDVSGVQFSGGSSDVGRDYIDESQRRNGVKAIGNEVQKSPKDCKLTLHVWYTHKAQIR